MARRIAVYGGSFNPFGKHHQEIVRWLIEKGGFNYVIVVPAAAHALKDDLLPYIHRYNMTKLGVNDLRYNGIPSLPFEASVAVSTLEMDMLRQHPGPIRTYELLKEIRKGHPDDEIKFAIGPDIPDELDRWANVDKIEAEFGFVKLPIQSMRATKLRQMMEEGISAWKQHVPSMVVQYIERHNLYNVNHTISNTAGWNRP
jgi:nicotinate-nucleotide adenylyltransferase